jgi:HSP20 family protein
MIIRRYDPFDAFSRMSAELEDWFDRSGQSAMNDMRGLYEGDWSPRLDLYEDDDSYFMKVDVPGVKQEDLELSVTNNVLTLKGKRMHDEDKSKSTKKQYQRDERFQGIFQRTVPMQFPIDSSKIEARLSDGVLYVILPKREENKPKKISVSVS